jgi:hypothetical protein
MKTLITALAAKAILTASGVAKTQQTKGLRIQPPNILSRNTERRTRVARINSYCRFVHGETVPDRRVRLQMTPGHEPSQTGNVRGAIVDQTPFL